MAEPGDTWQPYGGITYAYDDNIFRIPDLLSVGVPTSDSSRKIEAGATLDKVISKQHITANCDLSRTTFNRNSAINFDAKDLQANWAWTVNHDFTGNVGASYAQSLTPFSEFRTADKNIRTQKREYFDATWHMTPRWQIHTSAANYQLNYDLLSQKYGDRAEHTSELGFDYVAPRGDTVGILLRRERGDFPNAQIIGVNSVNNNYTQDELKAKIDWTFSGRTHLQFLGGWARREHDFFSVRDTSGPTARITATWVPTGKSAITGSIWRDINATDDLTASYTANNGLSIDATWDVLPRVRLETYLKHENRDFSGTSIFTSASQPTRQDSSTYASFTASYSPYQKVQINAVIYVDKLKSSIATVENQAKGMLLNLRISF